MDKIIVLVKHQGQHTFFETEKDIWIPDQKKWSNGNLPDFDYSADPRAKFRILDHSNIAEFLPLIQGMAVELEHLRGYLEMLEVPCDWQYAMDFFPMVFVDFDARELHSVYCDYLFFEDYLPAGWKGFPHNFYPLIQAEFRYWEFNGRTLKDYMR
jgi:hypothetical protein